jgi:hypothetical protein
MMNALRNLAARLKRPMFIAGLAVFAIFLVGEARLLRPVWRQHGGGIWGDSFTYVSFARQLARGHFYFDHPIAPLIKNSHTGGLTVRGPIWNTSVRDDGRIVYSVAIGYPAFLAAACKLGGEWLMLHANILLMTLVLVLLALIVWDAMDRTFEGLILACITALLLPRMDPATFNQFTYPWREPLSYVGILGAAWCVLRFRQNRRLLFLPMAGLLLGLACTVKEANIAYGIWLGLFVVLTPGVVRQRAFWVATAAAAATFAAGLAPLLVQNAMSSGNPLVSLQFVRETAEFSMTQTGTGLRPSNLPSVFRSYTIMYNDLPAIRWTCLLALFGLVPACRTTAGRFLLGGMLAHMAIYLQFGPDLRHMYFAVIPYTFFLAFGIWWIVRTIVAHAAAARMQAATAAAGTGLVLVLSIAPRPWGAILPPRDSLLKFRDLNAIVTKIESHMPANALVLVNRPLRDHWAVYGRQPVVRLHELQDVGIHTNVYDVLESLRRDGRQLFFLDATDREPRNSGRIDWSVVDREWLLWRYDLNPVYSLAVAGTAELKHLTDLSNLTVYAVQPWSNLTSAVECSVPTGGVAFLRIHPREAGNDMVVSLNGTPGGSIVEGYVLWKDPVTGRNAHAVVSRKSGLPVPSAPSVSLIGWNATIRQETNPFSDPPDSFCFPDGLSDQPPDARYRSLTTPFRLRVPARVRPDIFTVVSLNLGRVDESEWGFHVLRDGDTSPTTNLTYASPWIPITSSDAGFSSFRISELPSKGLRIYGFNTHTAWRRIAVTPVEDTVLIGVSGYMTPDNPGEGSNSWSSTVDGTLATSGTCGSNPFKHPRAVYACATRGRTVPYTFEWRSSGLVEPVVGQTGPRLALRMDDSTRAFCESGFFRVERNETSCFAWTMDNPIVRVPLSASTTRYRLTISAMDGCPTEDRTVTVTFAGQQRTMRLDDRLRDYLIEFQAPANAKGMDTLTMTVKTWSPMQVLKVPDPRELGFQFHGLVWEPLPPAANSPPIP